MPASVTDLYPRLRQLLGLGELLCEDPERIFSRRSLVWDLERRAGRISRTSTTYLLKLLACMARMDRLDEQVFPGGPSRLRPDAVEPLRTVVAHLRALLAH
jgi:hypothetical protein